MKNQEAQLVPYQTNPLPNGKWLVFAPHADDESIGLGGTLALAATQDNCRIVVAIVTDGAKQGETSVREQEALAATKVLGIASPVFLRLPDRQLGSDPEHLEQMSRLIQREQPDHVFFPSLFEFHPDHRQTALLVWQALQQIAYQGKCYSYEISVQAPCNTLFNISASFEQKKQAIACYHSQLAQNHYQQVAQGINRARTYTLPDEVNYAEAVFEFTPDALQFSLPQASQNYLAHLTQTDTLIATQNKTEKLPLISIIVRTQNREQLLRNALDSIQQQDYPSIEIVLINDGGQKPQDLANWQQAFAQSAPEKGQRCLQYIHYDTTQGRAQALNNGFTQAKGEWLGILDDDDIYYPGALSQLLDFAQQQQRQAVYGIVEMLDYGRDNQGQHIRRFAQAYDSDRFIFESFIPVNAVLLHRDIIEKTGRVDPAFEIFEDWDYFYRISLQTDFAFMPRVVAEYRSYGNSTAEGGKSLEKHRRYREQFYHKHFSHFQPSMLGKYYDFLQQDLQQKYRQTIDRLIADTETFNTRSDQHFSATKQLRALAENHFQLLQQQLPPLMESVQLQEKRSEKIYIETKKIQPLWEFVQHMDQKIGQLQEYAFVINEREDLMFQEIGKIQPLLQNIQEQNTRLQQLQQQINELTGQLQQMQNHWPARIRRKLSRWLHK